jgi:hypothetical protein
VSFEEDDAGEEEGEGGTSLLSLPGGNVQEGSTEAKSTYIHEATDMHTSEMDDRTGVSNWLAKRRRSSVAFK